MKYYKFCLLKAYFEKGYALTTYFKWMIAFFGVASNNILWTMIMGIVYIPICFIIGYGWYKLDFIKAEIEVHNQFDLFVKEMRRRYR